MKNLLLLFLLSFTLTGAFASGEIELEHCLDKLLGSKYLDSRHHTLSIDDVEEDFENNYIKYSTSAIEVLLKKLGCRAMTPLNFDYSKSHCRTVSPEHLSSMVCFMVVTSLGYFYIFPDQITTMHIIFNRFD